MKSDKLYEAMGDISERHIQDAKQKHLLQKPVWKKWQWAVACVILLMAGFWGYYALNTTVVGGLERHYKSISVSSSEIARTWPWEYLTTPEKYGVVIFEGREYRLRGNGIGRELLGETIGTCIAKGYDAATKITHTDSFEVRKINHTSQKYLVAVEMEGTYYVAICTDNEIPSTFGELMDIYGLPYTVMFDKAGQLAINNDSYIWQVFSTCRDARVVKEGTDWQPIKRKYLTFTITSEALGVYKRVFYVSEDGYIRTNIFEIAHEYEIGVEAAGKILSYVKENSTVTEREPFEYRIAGKLKAIEDEYVLIDDSVMCLFPFEGMVLKVPTDSIHIRRLTELEGIGLGDIVVVTFRGDIDVDNENTINGVVSLEKGRLTRGGTPE